MDETVEKVGFIGLGKMGAAICARIQQAGFQLKVYNRTASKMRPFVEAGAVAANCPREAAAGSDVVLTCLMDDQSVLEAVTGDDGVLAGLRPGGIHLGLTTILPTTSARLAQMHAEKGCMYIAGPVLARPDAVVAGQARTIVAGDQQAIERSRRVCEAYTSLIFNLGSNPIAASALKVCYNYFVAAQLELMGEIYAFAEKSGLDLDLVAEHLQQFFAAPFLKMYAAKIRHRDFDPSGFDLVAGLKDLMLFQQAFADARVEPGFGNVVKDKLVAGMACGMEHKDWSAIYEIIRLLAGLDSHAAAQPPALIAQPSGEK